MRKWRQKIGKKPRSHKCKSLRELNKIIRKYIKYVKDIYSWNVFYNILEDELRSDKFAKYAAKNSTLDSIRKDAIWALDNHLEFKSKDNETVYKFIGIQDAVDDYYWLYFNGKDYITSTCVGRVTDVIKYYGI